MTMVLRIITTLAVMAAGLLIFADNASASTAILRPSGDPGTSSWTPSLGSTRYGVLSKDPIDPNYWICTATGAGTAVEYYDLPNQNIGQGAKSVNVTANGATDYRLFDFNAPYHTLGVRIQGANNGVNYRFPQSSSASNLGCAGNVGSWPYANYTTTSWTGNWNQSNIDAMQLIIGYNTPGNPRSQALRQAYATVTYDATPSVTTYLGRVYQDSSTTTPGALLADYGDSASLTTRGQKFRLRMSTYNTTGDAWSAGYGTLRLQYAKKTAATCTAQTGWADVTTSSANIRFYDNPSITNNAAIAYQSGDILAPVGVAQTYRESNDAPVVVSIPAGTAVASWDYSLQEDPAALGGTFCFKFAPISPLVEYTAFSSAVEVSTVSAPLGVDIVNGSNVSVTNPVVPFGVLTAAGQCQQSNALLGDASQKVRIINGTATNGWSVSVAATSGSTSLWSSGGGDQYDYNDSSGSPAGCADSGDADTKAGQLTVKPAASVLTPSSGCSNTGVTKGSNAAYLEGSINAITLLSASSASQLYCAWDLTSVGLTQMIPPATPTGTYTLDLTMTAVAS